MEDGQIKIKAFLDSSELKSGLKKLAKVGKTSMGIVTKASKAAFGAYATLGASMGVVAKKGIDFNSSMEKYNASFKTMLGSQEKAIKLTEELRQMGASTPFELKDLAQAQQTLMAFGIESDKAKKYLKQLGDVSQGDTEKFKSLSLAFAQVQSAGKLTRSRFNADDKSGVQSSSRNS